MACEIAFISQIASSLDFFQKNLFIRWLLSDYIRSN